MESHERDFAGAWLRWGQTGSPKQILKLAYSAGMIQDEEKWLAMLVSRNDVTHSYNEEVALALIKCVKEGSVPSEEFMEIFLLRQNACLPAAERVSISSWKGTASHKMRSRTPPERGLH